ncbi:hypothetical protein RhiJN_20250 [Ceratobasidium sp. AG-Ba]|nr:hypothetical protein RhiJN_20250 [Ceratobasidium sp. AG-Ba]
MLMRYVGRGVGHFNHHSPSEGQATYDMDEAESHEVEVEHGEDWSRADTFTSRGSVMDDFRQVATGDEENTESDEDYLDVDEEDFEDELYDL